MRHLSGRCLLGLALVSYGAFTISAQAQQIAESDFAIEYSPSPSVAVITYHVETAIESDDPQPLLRVYGDGRAHVHKPWHNKDAGDYQFKLSATELAQLLEDLHADGVFAYDEAAVAEARKSARAARLNAARAGQIVLTHNSDVDVSTILLELESYRPAGATGATRQFTKQIRCVDLQNEAREYPEITALQGLAQAENTLRGYTNDPRLRKLPEATPR